MADDSVYTSFEEATDLTPFERMCLEISLAESSLEHFHKRGDKLVKKYRIEDAYSDDGDLVRGTNPYHVFWSNVQTLQPSLYSKTPKVRVSRRYKDRDKIGRISAEILERATSYVIKDEDFDARIMASRDDVLIPGLGQCWVSYKPQFSGSGKDKELTFAKSVTNYQFWRDFLWSPARQWDDVRWVAKKFYMSKEDVRERWKGREDGLSYAQPAKEVGDNDELKEKDFFKKATIYELWDKKSRTVYWLSPDDEREEFLSEKKDFLKLDKFFPCPKPLLATTTTNTLVPIADYDMYAEQAELLRDIQIQIDYLVRATKVAGVYDKNCPELDELLDDDVRNMMIPSDNWPLFSQQGGLKGATDFLDLTAITNALQQLYDSQARTLARMYEVTGISDIIRGQGNPYETAEAQRTKAQFATLRLQDRQKEIQRFVRDIIRIHAEIIAEHMDADILRIMTGVDFMTEFVQEGDNAEELYEQAVALLRKDKLRSFRIEIETDSTISPDRQQEKQQRIELLTAMTQFMQAGLAVGGTEPALVPAMGEMLLYGVRGFEGGRDIESTLELAIDQIKQKLAQPQAEPPPDPQLLKVQQDGEIKKQELQLKAQELELEAKKVEIEMFKAQVEARQMEAQHGLDAVRIKGALQIDQQKLQADVQKTAVETRLKAAQVQAQAQQSQANAQAAFAKVKQDDYRIHNDAVKLKLERDRLQREARKDLSDAVLKNKEINTKRDVENKKAEKSTQDKEDS